MELVKKLNSVAEAMAITVSAFLVGKYCLFSARVITKLI